MNRKKLIKFFGGLLIMLYITACTAQTLTINIKDNECTLNSPKSITYGEFTVKLNIEEENPSDLGYQIVTLEEGKTIEDLKALPSLDFPDWVTVYIDDPHLAVRTSSITRSINLTDLMSYQGEPLYFVCIKSNPVNGSYKKIGVFGPLEVKK